MLVAAVTPALWPKFPYFVQKLQFYISKNPIQNHETCIQILNFTIFNPIQSGLLNHISPILNVKTLNNFWIKFEIPAYSVLVDLVLVYAMYYYLADLG